ncbi:hypothetical protein SBBP1_120022 [Burkholderiales bacterium]|nr:hypothetical protein SBBP1_120022 [Burkholderiales bacterium]
MMGGKSMPIEPGAAGGTRICIGPAMAARDSPLVGPQGRCEPAKVARDGSTTRFELNGTSNGRTVVGKGQSTVSDDTVATSVDANVTNERGHHAMQGESQIKFVGADGQGINPVDELAREIQGVAH